MKRSFAIILAVIAVIAVVWGIKSYNGLVNGEEGVNAAWSDVENVYQRRADLIPNLVATVKGYAAHEQETLEAVVEARSKASQVNVSELSEAGLSEFQSAQNGLSEALGRLMVVVERYPELKANENFLDLQAQLEGTENRIAEARRLFNEKARTYNSGIRRFPTNIIAGIFGFDAKGYFAADEAAKQAPKVEF